MALKRSSTRFRARPLQPQHPYGRSKVAAIMLAVVIAIFYLYNLYRISLIADKHFKAMRDSLRINTFQQLEIAKSNDQHKRDHKHGKREEEERWDISNPGKSIIEKYFCNVFPHISSIFESFIQKQCCLLS